MSDIVYEYGPIDPWWSLEQQAMGNWLPTMTDKKWYSELDALNEASKQSRIQNTAYRVVAKDGTTSVPGPSVTPPTTWWAVEAESTPESDSWSEVENPDLPSTYRFWSVEEAQACAQATARSRTARTRVVSKSV